MPVNNVQHLKVETLADVGFVPEKDVHDLSPWLNRGLTVKSLMASLGARGDDNTTASIIRVVFNDEVELSHDDVTRFVLYLRVTKLHKVYEQYEKDDTMRYRALASWYFEALIDQPEFHPASTAPAVRCYLGGDHDAWEFGAMQFINEPAR